MFLFAYGGKGEELFESVVMDVMEADPCFRGLGLGEEEIVGAIGDIRDGVGGRNITSFLL